MSSTSHRAEIFVEKMVAAILQPDPTVPHKFFQLHCESSPLQPEKKLMIAVLEEAIHCLSGKSLIGESDKGEIKRLSRDAKEWILDPGSDCIFSFANICQVMGINPASAREEILHRQRERRARAAKSDQRL
ncbi:MAG: hypothetical protein ACE5E2_02840 [Candidatus Binatia bacterium]